MEEINKKKSGWRERALTQEGGDSQGKISGGGGILPGEFIGMDQGETLHIQKCEIVFVLEKGYVVYEKKRNQFALILFSD